MAASAAALPKDVNLLPGPVNGLVYRSGKRSALFYGDPTGKLRPPDALFLTQHRRDLLWAAERFLPEARNLSPFWPALLREKRLHDYENQSARVPVQALPALSPAPEFPGVESLATPGTTREAWSYFFSAGGQRIVPGAGSQVARRFVPSCRLPGFRKEIACPPTVTPPTGVR